MGPHVNCKGGACSEIPITLKTVKRLLASVDSTVELELTFTNQRLTTNITVKVHQVHMLPPLVLSETPRGREHFEAELTLIFYFFIP